MRAKLAPLLDLASSRISVLGPCLSIKVCRDITAPGRSFLHFDFLCQRLRSESEVRAEPRPLLDLISSRFSVLGLSLAAKGIRGITAPCGSFVHFHCLRQRFGSESRARAEPGPLFDLASSCVSVLRPCLSTRAVRGIIAPGKSFFHFGSLLGGMFWSLGIGLKSVPLLDFASLR